MFGKISFQINEIGLSIYLKIDFKKKLFSLMNKMKNFKYNNRN